MKLMVLYKYSWWWPQVYNEFKEYEKEIQVQSVEGHEICDQN